MKNQKTATPQITRQAQILVFHFTNFDKRPAGFLLSAPFCSGFFSSRRSVEAWREAAGVSDPEAAMTWPLGLLLLPAGGSRSPPCTSLLSLSPLFKMENGSKLRLWVASGPPPSPRGPGSDPWGWPPTSVVIMLPERMQWAGLADPKPAARVRGPYFVIIALIVTISVFLGITHGMGTFYHQEPCPEGWMYSRRKCFFFSEVQKSWRSSQDYCLSYGATLAVITNEDFQNFIASRMGSPAFWIGLRKTGDGLTWVNGDTDTGEMVEASAEGYCAYIQSSTISLSGCHDPRNWICIKEPYR